MISEPRENGMDNTRSYVPISKGTMISNYKIVDKIGAGGMGEVYLAKDTELNRKVALKFLPHYLVSDEDAKSRFKREAQAAAKLDHPNIVTIHEVSEHQSRPFIVMQYVEGQSLRDLMKGKELSLDRIIDLAIQICEGLSKAHQAGIIHRDIKPSNICIGSDGRPKLLDFGLAAVQGSEHLTKTGSTLGTIGYMSPEQIQGKQLDQRSDIFSFGVVLYEMITGRVPFRGETEAAMSNSILHDTPEPLARYKADIHSELQEVIDKVLDKDPDTRYQTASGLVADLKRLITLTQSPIAVVPGEGLKRWPLWAGIGVVAVMAVVALYSIWTTKETAEVSMPTSESLPLTRLSELPSVAVLYLENLSGSSDEDFFAAGMTEDIILDLSNIRGLRVLSRQDVVQYRGKQTNIKTIGEALNVDYVMEGSVRRAGDKLRVTAQLIKVADGFHVWAERFDRDMQDVFAVQAEIARSIAGALAVKLTPREKQVVEQVPTSNIAAYDLYLKGHQLWDERSKEDNAEAETLFRRAIALDENYALAYIGLAENFLQRVDWSFDSDRKWVAEAKILLDKAAAIDSTPAGLYLGLGTYYRLTSDFSLAVAAARRAVAIRPYDRSTHYVLAISLYRDNRWEEAEEELRIALDLKPNYAEPYRWLADMAHFSGNPEEAKRHIQKTVELAPDAAHILNNAQLVYFALGDFSKAEWYAREAIRLKPQTLSYVGRLGVIELFERNLTEAIAHLKTGAEGAKSASFYYSLGWAYRLNGDPLQANEAFRNALRQAIANLRTDSTYVYDRYLLLTAKAALGEVTDPVQQLKQLNEEVSNRNLEEQIEGWLRTAEIYAIVGDYDRALEYVRMVLDSRAYSAKYIAADPAFEGLKDDSRFQAMLEKYDTGS